MSVSWELETPHICVSI